MNAYLAEFIGTAILITMGCGVNAAGSLQGAYAKGTGWLLGVIGWGMAVALAIFVVDRFSGAHINPAVTLGLAVEGSFDWAQVPGYMGAQLLGAIAGACLVFFHYFPHWSQTEDPGTKLGVFSTSPAIPHTPANLFSEFFGTFMLIFGLLAFADNDFAKGLKPLVVGGLVTSIGICLGSTTGYAINPARDLGPRIAHAILPISGKGSSRWDYAWLPVVGPLLGGAAAAWVYTSLF